MSQQPGTAVDGTKNTLTAFYINGGVRELIPIYPLYALMFAAHGVDAFELSVLFSIWALVGIVLEVPSGALADTFSRKWLIVVSGVTKSAAFGCWYFWQDFYGYALGFVLWGAGSSLRSGAWEALLHDVLQQNNREAEFTRHYGRMGALATMGVVVGELTGGVLIVSGYDIVLLVSMVPPLAASVVFAFLVTEPPKSEAAYQSGYLDNLQQGLVGAFSNRAIFYLVLVFTFLVIAAGILDEYVNPITYEHGFTLAEVAYLSAAIALADALGQALSERFSWLSLRQLLGTLAMASLLLLGLVSVGGIWVPVALGLFFLLFAICGTLLEAELQHRIEGSARATVTSVVGLGDGVGAIIWFMAFGSMAQITDMTTATIGFAVITMMMCALFAWLARRWNIVHDTSSRSGS